MAGHNGSLLAPFFIFFDPGEAGVEKNCKVKPVTFGFLKDFGGGRVFFRVFFQVNFKFQILFFELKFCKISKRDEKSASVFIQHGHCIT